MLNVAQFRMDFPEFSNAEVYTPHQVQFYLNLAENFLVKGRWGISAYEAPNLWPNPPPTAPAVKLKTYDYGCELFTAHHIAMEAQQQAAADSGGDPGEATGPVNNKSVDKVSIGFDTASAAEKDGGFWNYTKYGQRFLRLAKMMGAGPIYLGIGQVSPMQNGYVPVFYTPADGG